MKIAIDTNVLFSGLYRAGNPPYRLIRYGLEERLILYAPDQVWRELHRILLEKLEHPPDEATWILSALPIRWVPEEEYGIFLPDAKSAISHEAGAPLVAVAMLAGAGIVSGDKAFHPLLRPLVKTWTPSGLLRRLERRPGNR